MNEHAALVLDIAGTSLTAVDRRRLAHPLTGGIILFGRNWEDRAQLSDLCAEMKSIRGDLLICVDHEGGRVQRFRTDGFTHLPPMRALGELWMKSEGERDGASAMAATNAASAVGYVLGAELRACGVDFSFTPVLDLDWQEEDAPTQAQALAAPRGGAVSLGRPGASRAPTQAQALAAPRGGAVSLGRPGASRSGVIGDRAFHSDARVVALLAKSLMHGLLRAGVANCGKHFPGHGFVKADSHTEIPVDQRSLKAILADDATPYEWLNTTLTSVMPAHVIYPKVDARPAGFSSRWLNEILRRQLRFDGAIFSDDLSMEGARVIEGREVSHTEAGIEALNAGCDMVLLCNQSQRDPQAVDDLLGGLAEAQLKGRWQASDASEQRRLALLPSCPAKAWDDLMHDPAYRHALDLVP